MIGPRTMIDGFEPNQGGSLSPSICTADNPWSAEKPGRAVHPDAKEMGEQEDDWWTGQAWVPMRCPHCGHQFMSELPQ